MKLTIIIPAYNVEKYIDKCIQSCIQPAFDQSQYEIIIINDGSEDNTENIAKNYTSKYANISLYTQPNQGLSSARNLGMQKAKGEYLWFVDSDDWIDSDSISIILTHLESRKDLYMIGACNVDTEGNITPRAKNMQPILADQIITGSDFFVNFNWQVCAPFYIFRKDFLQKSSLKFKVGIYHEDNEFTPRAILSASSCGIIAHNLYFVFQRVNSITRSVNPKKSFDLLIVCDSLMKYIKENDIDNLAQKRLYNLIAMSYNNALNGIIHCAQDDIANFKNELGGTYRHLTSTFGKCSKPQYRIEGILFRLFPNKILPIYKLLKKL